MSRTRIEIKDIRCGQPRPYADSIYEAELTFENWWDAMDGEKQGAWDPPEEFVKRVAQLLVHPFEDPPRHPLDSRLRSIVKLGRGRWRVEIVEPFCD